MKSVIAITLILSSFSSAHADEIDALPDQEIWEVPVEIQPTTQTLEPVASSSVKILGEGLADESTQESIALACVGIPQTVGGEPRCNQLRFVYVKTPEEAYYVGHLINVPEAAKARIQKKNLKKAIREYMTPRMSKFQRSVGSAYHSLFMVGTVTGAFYIAGSGAGAIVVFPAVFTIWGFYQIFGGEDTAHKLVAGTLANSPVTLTRQDGWNWSSQPKEISHKRFQRFLTTIQRSAE